MRITQVSVRKAAELSSLVNEHGHFEYLMESLLLKHFLNLFTLCEFHSMQPNLSHHPIPSYLHPLPPPPNKQKINK